MNNINNLKDKGQAGVNRVVEYGKAPPKKVVVWGVTAGAAVAGGLALSALTTVATPTLALAIGAIGGGAWGWRRMHRARPEVDDAALDMPAVETASGGSVSHEATTASAAELKRQRKPVSSDD